MTTTTRRTPTERVRDLLIKKPAMNEKEVLEKIKTADRKTIRAVRVSLGIDRQAAIDAVRGWLKLNPREPAKLVIARCRKTYGIHLGPPDVSRLRPKKRKKGAK